MATTLMPHEKGLRERRGSSTSLTIDLNTCNRTHTGLTSIKEQSSTDLSSMNIKSCPLSRHQLRHLKIPELFTEILTEFATLPNSNINSCEKVAGCSQKNRHRVWPISATRVRLRNSTKLHGSFADNQNILNSLASVVDNANNNYINANYITDANSISSYIATEGPMASTINDFWSMVWQEKAIATVMLTKLNEQAPGGSIISKCEKYWPEREGNYGDIHVCVEKSYADCGIVVHDICLSCNGEQHKLRHYWFTGWDDHNLPIGQTNKILKLIVDVYTYREAMLSKCPSGPIIVHCSAGIGRTCTFISITLGVEQLITAKEGVDVYATVSKIRMERYGAVPRPDQYIFIYIALQQMERLLNESHESQIPIEFREDLTENDDGIVDTAVHIVTKMLNLNGCL